jgi:hypothetical protein
LLRWFAWWGRLKIESSRGLRTGVGETWCARRYEPGDEAGILALRRLVFSNGEGARSTEEYWRWEYMDNPAGRAIIWLAVADGHVVGHYAVRPIRMQCAGKALAGSVSLDAMTHPDFRRGGVFATLGRETYKDVEKAGLDLTYIWPREVAMRGTIAKFDWKYMCTLPVLVKPLSPASVVERFVPNRALAWPAKRLGSTLGRLIWRSAANSSGEEGSLKWLDRFDERIDLFWKRASARHRIATARDSVYLNWRYFDNPGRRYEAMIAEDEDGGEVVGYAVVRSMQHAGLRGGMIVDLGSLPGYEDKLAAILARVELAWREQQMDLMACLVNGDEEYGRTLRKLGFRQMPFQLGFKEWYFGCRVNSPTLDKEFLLEPANWFLTFGDTDVI